MPFEILESNIEEIIPQQRLPTGESQVETPCLLQLIEDTGDICSSEFIVVGLVLVTVDTGQVASPGRA